MRSYCCTQFDEEDPGVLSQDEMFFTSHVVYQNPTYEQLEKKKGDKFKKKHRKIRL